MTNRSDFFRGMMEHTQRRTLTKDEIAQMDGANLVQAVGAILEKQFEDENELTGPQIVAYTLWLLDMEVQNGGLCQFLVNPSREVAPFVPSALMSVDAPEYEALLAHFLEATGIDLENLKDEDFDAQSYAEYISRLEAHQEAYEEFDNAYYALYEEQPLDELVAKYIRAHAQAFARQ